MKNKILIQICDKEYSIITEEPEDYVKMLASEITKMIDNTAYKNLRTSKIDATMITCLELCDKIHKLTDDNDNMRREIKSYVDEIGRLSKKVTAFERQKSAKKTPNITNSQPEPPTEKETPEKETSEKQNMENSQSSSVENNDRITENTKEESETESVSIFQDIDKTMKTNIPVYRQF